jgi:TM2 domain-containing membrane protein YozV
MVVTQNKNPGAAVLIALIAGLFGFQGIGHMYTGKTSKGIGLWLIGWLMGIYIVLFTFGGVLPMTIILESISYHIGFDKHMMG